MCRKLLLVDDDADDRQVFADIVRSLDHNILLESVEDGLEMFALLDCTRDEDLPDVIILDQNMPRMTGKEVLGYLKGSSRYRHIPAILYFTYQVVDFYHECLELGAVDVVIKPDTIDAYRKMVEKFIVGNS